MSMFGKETFKITYCPRKNGLGNPAHSMVVLIEAYRNGEAQMIFHKMYPSSEYDLLRCEKF